MLYDSWILYKTKLPEVFVVRLSAFPFSFFFFSFTGSAGSTTIASAAVSTLVGGDLRPTTVKHVGLPGTWYLATSLASSSNCQIEGKINSAQWHLPSSNYQFQFQIVIHIFQCWFGEFGGPSGWFSVSYEHVLIARHTIRAKIAWQTKRLSGRLSSTPLE